MSGISEEDDDGEGEGGGGRGMSASGDKKTSHGHLVTSLRAGTD